MRRANAWTALGKETQDTRRFTPRHIVRFFAVAIVGAGCGPIGPSPSAPPALTPPATQVFEGTVYPEGVTRMLFSMTTQSAVTIGLTSVDPAIEVGVGFGVPMGHGCDIIAEIKTAPGSASELAAPANMGDLCLTVFDVGFVGSAGASFRLTLRAR